MYLTVNKQTALFLLRARRKIAGKAGILLPRVDMRDPDPAPRARWTDAVFHAVLPDHLAAGKIDVCVSDQSRRLGNKAVSNTVYRVPLPKGSFLDYGNGLRGSSPELLFVELANQMGFPEHLLFGFELCGRFARDPVDPIGGDVAFEVPALTSVSKLKAYLDALGRVVGKTRARRTLALLADNAWSPTEAAVATMMSLPLEECGYGLGRCVLNLRVDTPRHLMGSAARESRVPDILVEGTHVGINYDGGEHLDLEPLVDAAFRLAQNPGSGAAARELDEKAARVRAKFVDDVRRNRELLADGYAVFQVLKEDLYQERGLDATMMQVLEALKAKEGWDVEWPQGLLRDRAACAERRELLSRLVPGKPHPVTGNVHEAIIRLGNRKRK